LHGATSKRSGIAAPASAVPIRKAGLEGGKQGRHRKPQRKPVAWLNARNGRERVRRRRSAPWRPNRAGLAFGYGSGRHDTWASEEKD